MSRAWRTLDSFATAAGEIELRQRGSGDFLITVAGRVLMNSAASRSEQALAESACAALGELPAPRVLIGGLGMGCTLRAALDALPAAASVVVAELHEAMLRWCRSPLAALNGNALDDPRVELRIGDVANAVHTAADPGAERFDAVLLDLYEGPASASASHPHYGAAALARTHAALRKSGVLAVWCEDPAPPFERALERAGFAVRCERPGRGGRRHAIYLASAR